MKAVFRVQEGGIGKAIRSFDKAEDADAYAVQCSLTLDCAVTVRAGYIGATGVFHTTDLITIRAQHERVEESEL